MAGCDVADASSVKFLARPVSALALVLLCAVAGPGGAAAAAQSPWFGTWKVNVAKSTYPGGPPAFKSMICTIEPLKERVRVTFEIIGTRGGVTHIEWTGQFDGREYPVAGIDGFVVTHAYRRVDDRTYDVVQRTEGAGTSTARMTLSDDGKTLTIFTPAATPVDAPVTVAVYDRQ